MESEITIIGKYAYYDLSERQKIEMQKSHEENKNNPTLADWIKKI